MRKQKPGTMIYWEMFDVLERLPPEKAKVAIKAIREYSQYGQEPCFGGDESLEVVWPLFAQKIASDNARYVKKCEQAAAAINSRWGKTDNTGVYDRIPTIPTTTETPTSSSSAYVTDDDDGNENECVWRYAVKCGFQNNAATKDKITEFVRQYGATSVRAQLEVCVDSQAHTLTYLETCLKNCRQRFWTDAAGQHLSRTKKANKPNGF